MRRANSFTSQAMPLPSLLPAGKRSSSGQEKEASEHADNHAERQPSFRKPEV
ncbi:hypothetical protein XACS582_14510004 [Xanthomonas citri pv. citri]|nr:hypothetical protein XACS584_1840006 [Xanthomonas citri pv. citri]CEF22804.1 hypothetical protein XACJK2_2180029 [Xanthomonas citri pv. citri]CEH59282.1 hypothetical protein XACJK48_9060008 [Xanthomonas citri pv. citri]CEH61369.1 hypothetical protein XACS582_14510004 [Xanthomonas citri pv. citri]CEI02973.1 hypothetical protein XACS581_3440024 [Xanthomonas citri pv. citri]